VQHQIEIDLLVYQDTAGAEEVLNGVERLDDLRFEAGFLLDFPQSGGLGGLSLGNRALG